MISTAAISRIRRNNRDAQTHPDYVAYIIDSSERLVYNEPPHSGNAIYIELYGLTRAIYTRGQPTTRAWGSCGIHNWLDRVHESNREDW
jgi:hypothetical protein